MLIVDDDPVHRALVARILAPLDLVVDEAGDALAALERMVDNEPRIVIVDLGSPPSGRAVFLEDLRKCSTAPVVVVSSTAGELDLVVGSHRRIRHSTHGPRDGSTSLGPRRGRRREPTD